MIKVANNAGFCFGVERAVNLAYQNSHLQNTVTLGPIIHNSHVIEKLKNCGVTTVDDIDETIENVIIRSHGVAKEFYDKASKLGINVIDATCPYVAIIHKLVKQNMHKCVIIIGEANHPEVIGINGWANNNCLIVKDSDDIKNRELIRDKKYFVVAQTTYKQEVVDKVLECLKGYDYEYAKTICSATLKRQQEAVKLAQEVDIMFIIGSKFSSNTQKLFEVCQEVCPKSYCIEDANGLDDISFSNKLEIGITAGASTPANIIDDVIKRIENGRKDYGL
ncbi:MAG: 4-hydroxy-3-methylbut-2-enyl diphosphate reductase [Epulopiscium sp. Nuni2H_MBin003]|nr:MAG: 4-hydroxy-3-methylbut-2-enyl diphosphate reductase [Epulopiscium sp. Nuni2H_MBin003]